MANEAGKDRIMKETDERLSQIGLDAMRKDGCFPGLVTGNHTTHNPHTVSLVSPCDARPYATLSSAAITQLNAAIAEAENSFQHLSSLPAPRRGELVRLTGEAFRQHKEQLAHFITLEAGKIRAESLGEVQEVIDICDFAVGLSRQLYGLTISSERPDHRMMEQWHPLGPIAIITAFNFPMAVWAWNAMLAIVCGNTLIWKPSEKTPLCALACHQMLQKALAQLSDFPENISTIICGDREIGQALAADPRIKLVSATGSTRMGKQVAQSVAARLGRSLLELGGNNAMIVTPSANISLALRAIVFSAVGTTGQRCTSLRRLIIHHSIVEEFTSSLITAYQSLSIGNPFEETTLVGPLIDQQALQAMEEAIAKAIEQGGTLLCGGDRIEEGVCAKGIYVRPALIRIDAAAPIMQQETFAPILYIVTYEDLSEAIKIHNGVPQGLSSAIFTQDLQEAEIFLTARGSDCGIANVNIGTSGAEIGGAFGGEKDTGGGRESGSDAWKNYMRRVTNTINYGSQMPLAQGIKFELSKPDKPSAG